MGLSSKRFCHAAIGRLMDGDRGHWFLTLGSCVWAPTTHSHLSHTHWAPRAKTIEIRNGKKTTTKKKKKKRSEESENLRTSISEKKCRRPANDVSFVPPAVLPPTYPPCSSSSSSSSFLAVLFTSRCTLRGYTHRRQIHIFIYIVSLYINTCIRVETREKED